MYCFILCLIDSYLSITTIVIYVLDIVIELMDVRQRNVIRQ